MLTNFHDLNKTSYLGCRKSGDLSEKSGHILTKVRGNANKNKRKEERFMWNFALGFLKPIVRMLWTP